MIHKPWNSKAALFCVVLLCVLPLLTSAGTPAEKKAKTFQSVTLNGKSTKWSGEPMSLDVKDLDLRDFFMLIADISKMNVILDPEVKGILTMKVHDVPWDQLLDLVCRINRLGYEVDGNVVGIEGLR